MVIFTRKVGSKTKRRPKKKKGDGGDTTGDLGTIDETTQETRKPRGKKDSCREQPSTAAMSGKKAKTKRKHKKQSKKNRTLDETTNSISKADAMLKALGGNTTIDEPPNPTCEDDPTTCRTNVPMPPPVQTPPTVDYSKEPMEPPSIKHPKANKTLTSEASQKTKSGLTASSLSSHTEKWGGESTAKSWLEKVEFGKTKEEFDKLQAILVNVDKDCKKWKSNAKFNQSEDYPALDANLVTLDSVYVNMTHLEVPLHRNVIVGQLPVKGGEEQFWKVIFEKRITFMHVIVGPEPLEFFPMRNGAYTTYGAMFINNRRVEVVNEDVHRFAIEVLPEGFSNSIITNITVIKNWLPETVHAKKAVVVKESIELINFLSVSSKDESALVLSLHGAGRAGYFVTLAATVYKMDLKQEPSIFDIVKNIRSQRPKAVDSLTQYVSIYISMFYYIKRKISKCLEGDKKALSDPNHPVCKKAVQLTAQFTNALVAEVNGRSTMTVLR